MKPLWNKPILRFSQFSRYDAGLFLLVAVIFHLKSKYLFIDRLWPDEALYAWFAREIYFDPAFIFSPQLNYPPLFPMLLTPFHFFFEPHLACRVGVFILHLLAVLIAYRFGSLLKDKQTGLLCSIIFSFTHVYYVLSANILIDSVLPLFYLFLAYRLFQISEICPNRNDVYVGICSILIALLKWSSFLSLLWIILFYIFALDQINIKKD